MTVIIASFFMYMGHAKPYSKSKPLCEATYNWNLMYLSKTVSLCDTLAKGNVYIMGDFNACRNSMFISCYLVSTKK